MLLTDDRSIDVVVVIYRSRTVVVGVVCVLSVEVRATTNQSKEIGDK